MPKPDPKPTRCPHCGETDPRIFINSGTGNQCLRCPNSDSCCEGSEIWAPPPDREEAE